MIHDQPEACCLDSNGLLDYVDGEAVLLAHAITHLLHIKASVSVSPRQGRDQCCKWPSVGGGEHSRSSSVRVLTSIAGWLLLRSCKVDVEGIARPDDTFKDSTFYKSGRPQDRAPSELFGQKQPKLLDFLALHVLKSH